MQLPSVISNIQKRSGANLPHWRAKDASYFVTFRLANSLPSSLLKDIRFCQRDISQRAEHCKRSLSTSELDELEDLHFKELDYLRHAKGVCYLRDDRIAQIVADALRFFDGKRYRLYAWSVMPNHVHVVLQPNADQELSDILHSWKSFTATKANKILKRKGAFWQQESYDHLICGLGDLLRCVEYTWSNPDTAGLPSWKWRWKIDTTTFSEG